MLSAIASALGGQIVDSLLGKVTGAFEAYFRKEISIEELRTRLQTALLQTFAEVEKAHADALARMFQAFMQAVTQSRLMKVVWAAVTVSQLGVLLWHQVGIPAYVHFTGGRYPSSGTTVEWAYLLLALCMGGGAVMLRGNAPGGAGSVADALKRLAGR